jgi:DinB superfamily
MSIFSNRYADARHEAGAYTEAVIGLLGGRDPVAVLERTAAELGACLAGVRPDELTRPEAPGKWSMLHVLRHLADSEIVWAYRIRRIVAEDRPPITGYDQDRWSERLHYEDADPGGAMAEFLAVRAGNLRLIRSLGPAERVRVGMHSERGEESVEHLIRMYAGHDLLHLNQLARIRTALASARV